MPPKSISNWQKGFTLLELIVAISIVAILSVIGIASFVDFSKKQTLSSAALDVETTLKGARSRAQSQVKPQACDDAGSSLNGYRVTFTNESYYVEVVCEPNSFPDGEEKDLPPNISITQGGNSSYLFRVLNGRVEGVGASGTSLALSGFGLPDKIITIHPDGRIVSQ